MNPAKNSSRDFTFGGVLATIPELGARLAKGRARRYSTATTLNALRHDHTLRIVAVAVTLLGWFVLSNHCALGSATKRAETKEDHACCHNGTSQPAKEPADGGQGTQCCKSVHAVVPDAVKVADVPVSLIVGTVIAWVETFDLDGRAALIPAVNTGPPPRAASMVGR